MSFLAPLFLLGTLFIAAPLMFHLVRRTPRGRHAFSSLMFLRASPPRIQRRSRIEDWLLLAMRIGVICLVALAFSRPFIPLEEGTQSGQIGRRIAVLLDTSASMRRDGVWDDAMAKVRDVFARTKPGDQVTVFTFDDRVQEVLGLDSQGAPVDDWGRHVESLVTTQRPTWGGTDIGSALVVVADQLDAESDIRAESDEAESSPARDCELVLISDLQRGSRLDALEGYAWPRRVRVTIESVFAAIPGNAGIVSAKVAAGPGDADVHRVHILYDGDGTDGLFSMQWKMEDGPPLADAGTGIVVPAGMGRVVSVPPPQVSGHVVGLTLIGDAHPFDNDLYMVPPDSSDIDVLYLGTDSAEDPKGSRYFLERALVGTSRRSVRIKSPEKGQPLIAAGTAAPHLLIGSAAQDPGRTKEIRAYLQAGGTMICIVGEGDGGDALQSLLGLEGVTIEEAVPADFALLGEIDFAHPLFARFADPRFNDFTAIQFWRYRRLAEIPEGDPGVRVLARFDDGAPYLIERTVGAGRVLVVASGWHPKDSRMALSTKFVPLLEGMLEAPEDDDALRAAYTINERIRIPDGTDAVHGPAGQVMDVGAGDTTFDGADVPGVYAFDVGGERRPFAVNLNPAESRTTPMPVDELDQRGVLFKGVEAADAVTTLRMHSVEEQAQQIWKWLLLAAVGLALVETRIAGTRSAAVTEPPAEDAVV